MQPRPETLSPGGGGYGGFCSEPTPADKGGGPVSPGLSSQQKAWDSGGLSGEGSIAGKQSFEGVPSTGS